MTPTPIRTRARDALDQRLEAVADEILGSAPAASGSGPGDPFARLEVFVERLQADPDLHRTWLLVTAVTAGFPPADLVREAHRRVAHKSARDAAIWLLRTAAALMTVSDAVSEIELVTDRPVVDVDFSARHDWLSGIQRVVRSVVPSWLATHRLLLVRWSEATAFCGLSAQEALRVGAGPDSATHVAGRRLVPWGVPVLLPEVPSTGHGDRLASLARYSPNTVRVTGYDCIPAVSGELVRPAEREKFSQYLEIVKFVDLVAGISDTAVAEFAGFVDSLKAQGLTGPRVVACPLPTTVAVPTDGAGGEVSGPAEVLCVGTLDRRKNQDAVVEAAEHLWREGVDLRLRLIGGRGGKSDDITRLVEELQQQGRPVVVEHANDVELDRAYRRARVVVFPTRHEGFGLPVVEALSYGVPVITSDFGSTREVGLDQGAVLVDPDDMDGLVDQLRRLLTDDDAHAALVERARARPVRGWEEYAAELWEVFVR